MSLGIASLSIFRSLKKEPKSTLLNALVSSLADSCEDSLAVSSAIPSVNSLKLFSTLNFSKALLSSFTASSALMLPDSIAAKKSLYC